MTARRFGKIVNVTINSVTMTRLGFTPYGPSRASSEALSEIMTRDLAGSGVTVNFCPGAALTGMTPEEVQGALLRTLLDPGIMGPPPVWLASRALDWASVERITYGDHVGPRTCAAPPRRPYRRRAARVAGGRFGNAAGSLRPGRKCSTQEKLRVGIVKSASGQGVEEGGLLSGCPDPVRTS